jgi:hypothetical protein
LDAFTLIPRPARLYLYVGDGVRRQVGFGEQIDPSNKIYLPRGHRALQADGRAKPPVAVYHGKLAYASIIPSHESCTNRFANCFRAMVYYEAGRKHAPAWLLEKSIT